MSRVCDVYLNKGSGLINDKAARIQRNSEKAGNVGMTAWMGDSELHYHGDIYTNPKTCEMRFDRIREWLFQKHINEIDWDKV